jgi:hypothetical protein
VLVECCLQEASPNSYYGLLAAKLAAHSKSHKVRAARGLQSLQEDVGWEGGEIRTGWAQQREGGGGRALFVMSNTWGKDYMSQGHTGGCGG